jgi:hypothetical protein
MNYLEEELRGIRNPQLTAYGFAPFLLGAPIPLFTKKRGYSREEEV